MFDDFMMLTQSEILEEKISPPAIEVAKHSEAEPEEAQHGLDL